MGFRSPDSHSQEAPSKWRIHQDSSPIREAGRKAKNKDQTPYPGMKFLNGFYTQRYGHVLQGRYKSILVEKELHLLELARCVVLNPIRVKMVRSVRDWPWSSYHATSGQAEVLEFLKIDWIPSQFDESRDCAIRAYRRFVHQGRGVGVWGDLRVGSLLGGADFVEKMQPRLLDSPLDQNVLRREQDAARPSLDEIFLDVRDKSDRDTRIHDAVRVHHYKLQEVADHPGLHFSTISVIVNRQASRIRE